MTKASELLSTAAKIVAGNRNDTHGDKERSFQVIAHFWAIYLKAVGDKKPNGNYTITPEHVAQMMVLMKIARSICGTAVEDHYIDEAGYAAIAGELASVGVDHSADTKADANDPKFIRENELDQLAHLAAKYGYKLTYWQGEGPK